VSLDQLTAEQGFPLSACELDSSFLSQWQVSPEKVKEYIARTPDSNKRCYQSGLRSSPEYTTGPCACMLIKMRLAADTLFLGWSNLCLLWTIETLTRWSNAHYSSLSGRCWEHGTADAPCVGYPGRMMFVFRASLLISNKHLWPPGTLCSAKVSEVSSRHLEQYEATPVVILMCF